MILKFFSKIKLFPCVFRFMGIGLIVSLSTLSSAQEVAASRPAAGMTYQEMMLLVMMGLTIFIALMVLITVVYALQVIRVMLQKELKDVALPVEESALSKWWKSLTNAVPVEKEETVMLDHNYDGIKELNNHLPPWWVYLFYGTIAFSVVYMLNYHVLSTQPLSAQEYELSMTTANKEVEEYKKKMASNINEENVVYVKDDKAALVAGKEIFDKECITCHGKAGEGGIGPNMTDEFWIHGGGIKNVFKTIKYGVPQKGMIAWEKKLKPEQMQNVASFILTLQGTNPPNAKKAEGEKYVEKQ